MLVMNDHMSGRSHSRVYCHWPHLERLMKLPTTEAAHSEQALHASPGAPVPTARRRAGLGSGRPHKARRGGGGGGAVGGARR